MELFTFADPELFYQRARPFLLAREAENNLILGIAGELLIQGHPYQENPPPFLSVVEESGQVIAVALRTPPQNLVLSLVEPAPLVAGALSLLVNRLGALQPSLTGVTASPDLALSFADLWQQRTGYHFVRRDQQRIYQLEVVRPVIGVSGSLRPVSLGDSELLVNWLAAFFAEALHQPDSVSTAEEWVERLFRSSLRQVYLWEDGTKSVSLVGCSGRTPNGRRIGPVYTPAELRGRGYASAATAALSQLLLGRGCRYCFLFTDLANPTSNHIYQEIGYQPVADVDVYERS
ncbi:MAG: GNAT family N-acetyltransferase [Ktedonobacterales bacterium]